MLITDIPTRELVRYLEAVERSDGPDCYSAQMFRSELERRDQCYQEFRRQDAENKRNGLSATK